MMDKPLHTIFLAVIIFFMPLLHAHAEEDVAEAPELQAETALLMEAQSGQILYSKNPDKPMYPASITKILTGIIAIESGRLDDTVTVSYNAINAGGTRVYLEEGEQKKLRDLVYALLINSGNDAAVAIAEHLGGSEAGFAKMMNEKARELGATHSHFVNPSGMPDDDHVTTAHDMALITRYAMNNATFREVVGTKEYPWEGEGWQPGHIVNHNRLLWDYEGATGVKNGYTDDAQQTFVASSERDGQKLIAVTLKVPGSSKNIYHDLEQLMDYGYEAFETHRIALDTHSLNNVAIDGEEASAQFLDGKYFVTLPKGSSPQEVEQQLQLNRGLSLPINKGEDLGNIRLLFDDEVIQEIPIFATSTVAAATADQKKETTKEAGFPWTMWLISLLIFTWCVLYYYKQWKHRRRVRSRFQSYRSYRG